MYAKKLMRSQLSLQNVCPKKDQQHNNGNNTAYQIK